MSTLASSQHFANMPKMGYDLASNEGPRTKFNSFVSQPSTRLIWGQSLINLLKLACTLLVVVTWRECLPDCRDYWQRSPFMLLRDEWDRGRSKTHPILISYMYLDPESCAFSFPL